MKNGIKELLNKISVLNKQLSEKYNRLADKYGFSFSGKKIIFLQEFRRRNKSLKFLHGDISSRVTSVIFFPRLLFM